MRWLTPRIACQNSLVYGIVLQESGALSALIAFKHVPVLLWNMPLKNVSFNIEAFSKPLASVSPEVL